MRSLVEFVERPLGSTIVMLVLSTIAAVIFFQIGGSAARVTGQEGTVLGVGFEAGGAVAGFLLIFLFSTRQVEQQRRARPAERLLREYELRTPPNAQALAPTDDRVACEYRLYDREDGGWGPWKSIGFVRNGSGLKITVSEMAPQHVIQVRITDGARGRWVSVEDHPFGVSPIYLTKAVGGGEA